MVGNAGVFSNWFRLCTKGILCLVAYNFMYEFLKWPIISIAVCVIFSVVSTPFPEYDSRPVRQLKAAKEAGTSSDALNWDIEALHVDYPRVSEQIDDILDLVVRDFVLPWFQKIDTDGSAAFPQSVKGFLLQAIATLRQHLSSTDVADLVVLKVLPLLTRHFKTFCSSREAVLSGVMPERHGSSNMNLQVAVEYNKSQRLHEALSLRASCQDEDVGKYITKRVEKLLPYLIDLNELESPYVSILLREVFSTCLVAPVILKYSQPDNWNLALISISHKILEEHDQVLEIRRILSKEVETQDLNSTSNAELGNLGKVNPELRMDYTEKQFEDYLREISLCNSSNVLKAARLSLLSKLLLLKDDKTQKTRESMKYKRRISLSLNLIQSRLKYVGSRNDSVNTSNNQKLNIKDSNTEQALEDFSASLDVISFEDILADKTCYAHFKSYLQAQPSNQGLSYLNFHKLVERMKTPLEDSSAGDITVTFPPSEIQDLRDMIVEFGSLDDLRLLDYGLVKNIILFASKFDANDDQAVVLARRSMLLLQNEAKKALLREFFDDFKNSECFVGMISDPAFIGTEPYSKLLNFPKDASTKAAETRLSAARIFSSPHIDDALDNMLKMTKTRRKYSEHQYANRMALFGHEDVGSTLFKDSLFTDDTISESEKEKIPDHLRDSQSDVSSFKDLPNLDSSPDRVENTFANLKGEIANLTIAIDQIEKELGLLGHLILKAELTNNQHQLRLLNKSQRALMKDFEKKELLKQQYLVQENANSLFKKTTICIKSYYLDQELKNHREIAYYLINVNHVNNGQVTSWEIPRRFSEFHSLNVALRRKYKHSVPHLQRKDIFPEKIKISLKYHVSKSLLYEERKSKLEKYLRELLNIPDICQDDMFRLFLTNLASFDSLHNPRVEQKDPEDLANSIPSLNSSTDLVIERNLTTDFHTRQIDSNYDQELSFYDDERNLYTQFEINYHEKSFVKAICDFFISVFSLNKNNSGWLRGRAIITVLQQLLGSAIENYIKDNIKRFGSDNQISDILLALKTALWSPQGVLAGKKFPREPRTEGEIARTKLDSQVMLQCLFAEVCGKVVGFRNVQNAAINIHEMLQNPYLNASLLLEILDLTFDEIFSENDNTEKKVDGHHQGVFTP